MIENQNLVVALQNVIAVLIDENKVLKTQVQELESQFDAAINKIYDC